MENFIIAVTVTAIAITTTAVDMVVVANCPLYNTFLHNMTCCHKTLFAKTN